MRAYLERENWWLDDYALFRALHAEQEGGTGSNGRRRCATAMPRRLAEARARLERRHPLLLLAAMGRRRAVGAGACRLRQTSRSSATSRSWSVATAPTSGHASTSSDSTRRSAFRPTRSPRPDRTGACRSIAGTCSRRTATSGCNMRARRCAELFDGFRVDHLVGFYRTFVREKGRARRPSCPPTSRRSCAQGERLVAHLPRQRRLRHRRGSRRRPRFRARVAGRRSVCPG